MSTKLYFNKRTLKNKFRANKRVVFNLLGFFLILTVIFSLLSRESQEAPPKGIPAIAFINTGEKIYTVTVNITGSENRETIELFTEMCGGFGIKPTFFITGEWLEKNTGTGEFLKENGNIALLCIGTASMSRNELMRYIALQNDVFYRILSVYPKYVREIKTANDYMGEILAAYGQYYISQNNSGSGEKSVASGDIVALSLSAKDDAYAFAQLVSAGIKSGLTAVDMKDFMNEYEKQIA